MSNPLINILIFNHDIRETDQLSRFFDPLKYNVFKALSETDTDEILVQNNIEILFLSIDRTDQSEYLAKIKRNTNCITVLTGSKTKIEMVKANRTDLEFLPKPFNKEVVISKLKHLISYHAPFASNKQNENGKYFDFEGLRKYIVGKLEKNLDSKLVYHSLRHTLNVEKAVIKYGKLENLSDHELYLTRTAALFHDAGFIQQYDDNEHIAVNMFKLIAPQYGYSKDDIRMVERIILTTIETAEPLGICGKIMCDADLDYLGRKDYHDIANHLFEERQNFGIYLSEEGWLKIQINYLENIHRYYTKSAQHSRNKGKRERISELKSLYKSKFG